MFHQIIQKTEKEQGVRNLKRAVYDIVSNINLMKILQDDEQQLVPVHVTEKQVAEFIKSPKNSDDVSKRMMYIW